MTLFEEKVNEYRENKRLLEELEAMNESIKADIICMMQGAPEMALSATAWADGHICLALFADASSRFCRN